MFEQTFVEGKTKTTWTVLTAFIAQTALIIVAVILPMIYFDVLPKTQLTSFLVAPPPPPPPPPPPAVATVVKIVKVIPRQFDAGRLMAPKSVPHEVVQIREDELPPSSSGGGGVVGGVPGRGGRGASGGRPGGWGRRYSRRRAWRHHRVCAHRGPTAAASSRQEGYRAQAHHHRRQRPTGQVGSPAQAGLPAARQAGAHFGRGPLGRRHFQGRHDSGS